MRSRAKYFGHVIVRRAQINHEIRRNAAISIRGQGFKWFTSVTVGEIVELLSRLYARNLHQRGSD